MEHLLNIRILLCDDVVDAIDAGQDIMEEFELARGLGHPARPPCLSAQIARKLPLGSPRRE